MLGFVELIQVGGKERQMIEKEKKDKENARRKEGTKASKQAST